MNQGPMSSYTSSVVNEGGVTLKIVGQYRTETAPRFQVPLQAEEIVMEPSHLDQIILRQVTRFLLCFEAQSDTTIEVMLEHLRIGLARSCEQLPFVTGSVQYSDDIQNKVKLVYKLGQSVNMKVVDLSKRMLSYSKLRDKNFPPSELKEELLSPLPNFIHPKKKSQPVLMLQATILEGGLILCVCVHHTVFDGMGQGLLMKLLSANCALASNPTDSNAAAIISSFSKTTEEMFIRRSLFSNIDQNDKNLTHSYEEYHIPDPSTISPIDNIVLRPCTSRLFIFSAHNIKTLKSLLNRHLSPDQDALTCHDALGALAWHCVTLARLRSGRLDPLGQSQLVIPIDCRPHLSSTNILPDPYLGNAALCLMPSLPISTIINSTPAHLASIGLVIRQKIAGLKSRYILGLAHHAQQFKGDINTIKPAMQSYLGPDVTFVSWAGFGAWEWDFGRDIGKVDRFRCPWRALDGVVKILPRTGDREWEVVVEMESDVMAALLEEEGEWMAWVDEVV